MKPVGILWAQRGNLFESRTMLREIAALRSQ
ncbi:hypothetical protein DFR30_0255 [Thiogranum longum]|uniref:Uncharacterized protein n=1 Tax=Thiogranum longum TaxID=1537524 RepID=A0A4R1HA53_9GAMM|nr:hypothetical protein DFR30_0255 [Thiogranum longum]